MNAMSRERLVPLDIAADAVTPMYLLATAADLHPTYLLHDDVHGRTIYMVARRPLYSEGVQRVPLVFHSAARK